MLALHKELWAERDPSLCCVCLQPQATAHPLVKCAHCDKVVVHPNCYPPGPIPRSNWKCDECLYAGEAEELWGDQESVECCLCQCPRSCLAGLRRSEGDRWVHGLCASVLTSHATLDRATGRYALSSIESEPGEPCSLCRGNGGVLIKCEACKLRVHATCGMSPAAVKLMYSVSDSSSTFRCPSHAASLVLKVPRATPLVKPTQVKRAKTSSPLSESLSTAKQLPPPPPKPYVASEYLNRRVSVFREGVVGTVVAAPAGGNLQIDLDDGKTKISRMHTSVRLIEPRPPGCSVCGKSDQVATILLCDGCDLEMHMGCHKPPIKAVPTGKWFCPQCREDQQLGEFAKPGSAVKKTPGGAAAVSAGKSKTPASSSASASASAGKGPAAKKAKTSSTTTSSTAIATTLPHPSHEPNREDLVVNWSLVFSEMAAVQCAEILELLARHSAPEAAMSAVRTPLVRDVMPLLSKLPSVVREGVNKAVYQPIALNVVGMPRQKVGGNPEKDEANQDAGALERMLENTVKDMLNAPLIVIDAAKVLDLCRPLLTAVGFASDLQRTLERISDDAVDELDRLLDPAKRAEADYVRISKEVLKVDVHGYARVTADWRQTPYPRRQYKELTTYEPAPLGGLPEETESLLRKLETTKQPACDATEECAKPYKYSLITGSFESSLSCVSQRIGCSASKIGRHEPFELGNDVEECDAWGVDTATRKIIEATIAVRDPVGASAIIEGILHKHIILRSSPDMAVAVSDAMAALKYALGLASELPENVPTYFLSDALGWSSRLQRGDRDPSPIEILRALQALHRAIRRGMVFKVHPKGVGVRCIVPQGAKSGTFIGEYLGELYSPWRWFERQDAVKLTQRKLKFKPALPDFYNIMLERHMDDESGYDVLYVDPIVKGNFCSRLSHSCDPNCCTVVMAVDGKFTIAVYALRDIAFGEELTFDYSSVTEDETEFKSAICLCGSSRCRGSFLFYAGQGAFAAIMSREHKFLDRTALLFDACCGDEPPSEVRLARHGFLSSVLPREVPTWMRKWTDLVLRFIDYEREELARELVEKHQYSEQQASIEAKGVAENRRQNVAVTVDKVKYFFRHAAKKSTWEPALTRLSDSEVADFLWNNVGEAVAYRVLDTCKRALLAGLPRAVQEAWGSLVAQIEVLLPKSAANRGGQGAKAQSASEAREMLSAVRDAVYAVGAVVSPHVSYAESLGDVLTMHVLTETWFTASNYESVTSPPVHVRNVDIGRDSTVTMTAQGPRSGGGGGGGSKPVHEYRCSTFQSIKLTGWEDERGRWSLVKGDAKPAKREKKETFFAFSVPLGDQTVKWFAYECIVAGGAGREVGDFVLSPQTISSPVLKQVFTFHSFKDAGVGGSVPYLLPKIGAKGEDVTLMCVDQATVTRARFLGESAAPAPADASDSDAAAAAAGGGGGGGRGVFYDPNQEVGQESKVYRSGFTWGQLSGWFKQTVNDPSSSLSAERRGTLSLPDIESCTLGGDMVKYAKCRPAIIKKLREKPESMWPVDWPFSFKNKGKVYGSPWFDDALDKHHGRPAQCRNTLIAQIMEDRDRLVGVPASSGPASAKAADCVEMHGREAVEDDE